MDKEIMEGYCYRGNIDKAYIDNVKEEIKE